MAVIGIADHDGCNKWTSGMQATTLCSSITAALRPKCSQQVKMALPLTQKSINSTTLSWNQLRADIQGIISCNTDRLLFPNDACTKDHPKSVKQVLKEKHPVLCILDLTYPACPCFEEYKSMPKAIQVSLLAEAISKMAL